MKQYRIEAYTPGTHNGRPRVFPGSGINPAHAVDTFHAGNPDCVVRTVWEFIPPGYWSDNGNNTSIPIETATETDPNFHLEDKES